MNQSPLDHFDECAGHASPGVDHRGADLWPKAFLSSLLFSQFLLLAHWPYRGPIVSTRRLRRYRARGRGSWTHMLLARVIPGTATSTSKICRTPGIIRTTTSTGLGT